MFVALIVLGTAVATLLLDTVIRQFLPHEKHVEHHIEHCYGVHDAQFQRTMGSLFYSPFVDGNRVTALMNGEAIFPAMLHAIQGAQKTINFETFIFWEGEIGRAFAHALGERASAGVTIHVLLDWAGSRQIDEDYIKAMEAAGVVIRRYRPIHWYNIRRLNHRTHRKLLIVDGRIGFTGGVGIADEWQGHAQDPQHWRDTHFCLEGPAVMQLQAAFMDNWLETSNAVLHGEDYFPPLAPVGEARAQVFQSSPSEGSQSMRLMYLMAITAACESIRIATAYFIPDDLATRALIAAYERGVKIEIIVPGEHTDIPLVRLISRARYGPLLAAGIAIYEFQPTMFHTKVMIVDDYWVSAGSTNFDNRSFRLNDEANLNVLDEAIAREQVLWFEQDKSRSQRITLADWRRRKPSERFKARLAWVLETQL